MSLTEFELMSPKRQLEHLSICIAKLRPQNNFIQACHIEWGWTAQPDYRFKHLTD